MDKKNYSRSNDAEKEQGDRQPRYTRENMKKQYQRISTASIERRWTNMGTRWDSLYRRTDIYSK